MGEESMCDQSALEVWMGDTGDIKGLVRCEGRDTGIVGFCCLDIVSFFVSVFLFMNRISDRAATRSKVGRFDLLDVLDAEETEDAYEDVRLKCLEEISDVFSMPSSFDLLFSALSLTGTTRECVAL